MGKIKKIPIVVGSSFHVAPLDALEKLAICKDDLPSVIKEMSQWVHTDDLVVLSTCNRTEILATTDDVAATKNKIISYLNTFCEDVRILPEHLFCCSGPEAVTHLFTVICGMDSMVLGETEIIGQMQYAYGVAQKEGFVSNYLVQLFESIFRTSKRVRGETNIDKGTTSVAKAGVHMAERIVGDLSKRSVLMIGAGETGGLTCCYLNAARANIYVANRTVEKAQTLANEVGGQVVALDEIDTILPKVDVVFLATGSKTPLITYDMVTKAQKQRKGEMLLILDLSLPHNVEPTVADIGNVFFIDMNDLKEVVVKSISKRAGEKKSAQVIIDEEVVLFFEKQRTLEIGPLIAKLRNSFENVSKQELSRFENKLQAGDKEVLEQFATSLVNKLLHWPTLGVRDLANDKSELFEKVKWFEKLFGLDKSNEERKNKK